MTPEQAVARFLQTQQQLQDEYRAQYNDIPAEYYDELLDQPMKQFEQDLIAAGLEPGDYEWALACHQTQLQEFMGDGTSCDYLPELRAQAQHTKWLSSAAGIAAVLKYPELADFTPDFDPTQDYLDSNCQYAQTKTQMSNRTPSQQLRNLLANLKARI